jgi:2C-methyl-D-erythritol 2,4-cyclodiphosphate synthase
MRVGIGYDIHRFEDGRRLVLGGVALNETGRRAQ